MGEAAFWGFIAAAALIVGAEVAFAFKFSRFVIGMFMAFGVGALIAAVSFELVSPALEHAEGWEATLGLWAGALAFFFGDRAIARMGGDHRKGVAGEGAEESEDSGLGIVLGAVLDGIPESAVLGMSLVGGGGVSLALLAGIWASNFPESLSSSVAMVKSGTPKSRVRLMWWGIALICALAAALGFAIVDGSDSATGAFVEAFAAGALLCMIADEMAPKAYDRSKIYAGLATVAGFGFAVFLSTLE